MLLLFIYLGVAVLISFLCSLLESTLMSTPLTYLSVLEEQGNKSAIRLKEYKQAPEKPLAAILSLNTIANTIGAAGVGAQATELFGSQWFGLVSAFTTLLILIFSEIIPKTIGSTQWRKLTGFTASCIGVLIVILYPFVWLVMIASRKLKTNDGEALISREEVSAMVSVGEEEGVIEKDEKKVIQNVLKLDDIKVTEAMTPRVVAETASEATTLKEYYDNDEYDHHSRIPVWAEDEAYITGYILRDDALEEMAEDHFDKTLGELKRPIKFFSEDISMGDAWEQMLKDKEQIALIIDEYGCFQGILTLEDIIETIFGLEIIDENDEFTDMQQYARDRWSKRQKKFKKKK